RAATKSWAACRLASWACSGYGCRVYRPATAAVCLISFCLVGRGIVGLGCYLVFCDSARRESGGAAVGPAPRTGGRGAHGMIEVPTP
ncbi:hypothetical protein, partial [Pseudofrankia sp. BMG5.37]